MEGVTGEDGTTRPLSTSLVITVVCFENSGDRGKYGRFINE